MRKLFLLFILIASFTAIKAQVSHTCDICKGTGKEISKCSNHDCHNGAIYCKTCDFRGVINNTCNNCGGSGQIANTVKKVCNDCNGERYFRMSKQTPCSCRGGKRPITRYGRTEYIDCSRCNGSGYLTEYYNAACRPCAGTGYKGTEIVYNTCYSCNGKGNISETCYTCNGKGCYPCSTCGGYARISTDCSECHGSGKVYTQY